MPTHSESHTRTRTHAHTHTPCRDHGEGLLATSTGDLETHEVGLFQLYYALLPVTEGAGVFRLMAKRWVGGCHLVGLCVRQIRERRREGKGVFACT